MFKNRKNDHIYCIREAFYIKTLPMPKIRLTNIIRIKKLKFVNYLSIG